jgi:hypothetical protein
MAYALLMRWIAVLVGVLVMAAPAQAATTISPESGTSFPYQQWVDEAKVPTPDVTLRVVEQGCHGSYGYATACTRRDSYTIWLDPTVATRRRAAFLHELGHNFDYYALTDADRQAFANIAGDWDVELFAEVYRSCATGWHQRGRLSERPPLSKRKMRSACYLIRR